ncbi:MAG: selenium-dependent xanthine dehydrogenase [Bacteroidota bacterium]
MIHFHLNGESVSFNGDHDLSLLKFLRNDAHITSVKDGCSAQAACGACLVEIDGKARLSCTTKMKDLEGAQVITLEGVPESIRDILAKAYVEKGAVQCGFCTPGLLMRTKILLHNNPSPSREEIKKALVPHLCRCTGYVKILDAIELAASSLKNNTSVVFSETSGNIGTSLPKYQAVDTALGKRPFLKDIHKEGMLYGVLKFSEHPRAKIISIDISKAKAQQGVTAVFTSKDIPGNKYTGLIYPDWPLMIAEGETTRYIGDVLACVVAVNEDTARLAAALIDVKYEVLEPVTDPYKAIESGAIQVHPDRENLLEKCIVRRGEAIDEALKNSAFTSSGFYTTQRIEHAFLEPEAALAFPFENGIELLSQGQGVYVDRKQIASLLGLTEENVKVTLVPCGGGFGGREDMTVQGHAALCAFLLKKPVQVSLTRDESIIMHPKRHPVFMDIAVGCDKNGILTALKMRAVGDSGAYASVGTKVMERVAGHASGAYHFASVDLEALTVYTNNIPCGAMRGFGANQAAFALESCIDELCKQGNFDRWQFRFDNALETGKMTATGQVLEGGIGVKKCLEAIKEDFYKAKYAGIACGIKNAGVGNGMPDFSDVKIEIVSENKIIIHHGWTEMGQGIQNMVIQTLCEETKMAADKMEVVICTSSNLVTGMTTSSRATMLACNAVIDACKKLNEDLSKYTLQELAGKSYPGHWICDWTTKPGSNTDKVVTHFAYGYAAQLCVLNNIGEIEKFIAAHDAGKIMNPALFEGQIEGAVHMGLGYALSENLPMKDGKLLSTKLKDLKILKSNQIPEIKVIGVEVADPHGPYGAKGLGEIGLVPTAAAVANAFCHYSGKRQFSLPLEPIK